MLTPSRAGNAGGLVMLGRSDGVLNPGGVRFGSAELYDVLEAAFGAPAGPLADCLAVGQLLPGGADERVVLAVRLAGGATLGKELEDAMRAEVRKRRSARHVPARVGRDMRADCEHELMHACRSYKYRTFRIHSMESGSRCR
jgi:acetoacetyl-CoA synthetase